MRSSLFLKVVTSSFIVSSCVSVSVYFAMFYPKGAGYMNIPILRRHQDGSIPNNDDREHPNQQSPHPFSQKASKSWPDIGVCCERGYQTKAGRHQCWLRVRASKRQEGSPSPFAACFSFFVRDSFPHLRLTLTVRTSTPASRFRRMAVLYFLTLTFN